MLTFAHIHDYAGEIVLGVCAVVYLLQEIAAVIRSFKKAAGALQILKKATCCW